MPATPSAPAPAGEGEEHSASEKVKQTTVDPEVDAISRILEALDKLDSEERARVLHYVIRRLGIKSGETATDQSMLVERVHPEGRGVPVHTPGIASPPSGPFVDIRTLKDQKQPRSLNEMTALVAYYLREVARGDERKTNVTAADIEKYFKQAGSRLPSRPIMALVNARQAGYLDPAGGTGEYKLNPVGYNLVAHSMPGAKLPGNVSKRTRARRTARKPR